MEVYKTFTIEAARSLPKLPNGHPCQSVHGHSFKITITVEGKIDKNTGFVMDFADIDSAFRPIYERIDHTYLNEINGLENPSSENLCRWIWKQLDLSLNGLKQIEVKETESTGCIYKGE
ncbi:MAG: 6-carboxytetrahydropterin synthase QueD [Candidatus Marinimicrobia bacterium]|nr:6-carboxytetrahydropterin synthase QueD [Candidatus Neomarinimicrobiota bacterium]|tara:strand:+ start:3535 stop:3891 length:357 start_codon:yes stop_codon:yes gene_type:complete